MNRINNWNITSYNMHQLNDRLLSPEDVAVLQGDNSAKRALDLITKTVVNSPKGCDVLNHIYESHPEHKVEFSIGHTEKGGLTLLYNKSEQTIVLRNETLSDVFPEVLRALEELKQFCEKNCLGKKQISVLKRSSDEVVNVESKGKDLSKAKASKGKVRFKTRYTSSSCESTSQKVETRSQKIFSEILKQERDVKKKSGIFFALVLFIEATFALSDVSGSIRNMISAVDQSAMKICSYFGSIGYIFVTLSSLSESLKFGIGSYYSFVYRSVEGFLLNLADTLSALGVAAIGVAYTVNFVAVIKGLAALSSHVLNVIPIVIITRNLLALTTIVYKMYITYRFKSKLAELVGDGKDPQKIQEAFLWLKSSLAVSSVDAKSMDDPTLKKTLAQKWIRFKMRVGDEAIASFEKIVGKDVDAVLKSLKNADPAALSKAAEIVAQVQKECLTNLKTLAVSFVATIALTVVAFAMMFDGGLSSSVALSVISSLVLMVYLFASSPYLREWVYCRYLIIKTFVSGFGNDLKKRYKNKDYGILKSAVEEKKKGGHISEGMEKPLIFFGFVIERYLACKKIAESLSPTGSTKKKT